jgi:hypothetical protein
MTVGNNSAGSFWNPWHSCEHDAIFFSRGEFGDDCCLVSGSWPCTHVSSPVTILETRVEEEVRSADHDAPHEVLSTPLLPRPLGPNNLGALFSNIRSLPSTLNFSDQFLYPYKTRQNYNSVYLNI